MRRLSVLATLACLLAAPDLAAGERADVVFADFEADAYGDWKAEGTAFGPGPAAGTLPGQMPVTGFKGRRLVNSFHGGDAPTGTLTSPSFTIDRKYVSFLVGGGGIEGKTCMNLLVEGKPVRTATGPNTQSGGSEALGPASWDVADLAGRTARLQIVDNASGAWGHVNIDHVVFTDAKPAGSSLLTNPARTLNAQRQWLCLPVKNGAKVRTARVSAGGQVVREFTIEAADAQADWWASLDVSGWKGQPLTVTVDRLPEGSGFLASLEQQDSPQGAENLYREPLRPQFHFSPARGWTNDPNGLSFYKGEYHLFFQHNPYGVQWGNMHWGHAVSRDLIRWKEMPEALYPDRHGAMFSGSAVVDWNNTAGLGAAGEPPLALLYTAAGADVQCLATSTDGRTFIKYEKNPVVKRISGGNRDPKVIWHEPTKRWVMALYVAAPQPAAGGAAAGRRDTIQFLTSPDLKDWTAAGQVEGFFECPDLFPLAVDGDPKNVKWVLTAASSDYMLGQFDGRAFTPETPKLKGHRGRGFYAAQTFADLPPSDGRRVQIGWLQAPAPGMPFNQAMSVPLELKLLPTPDGPRLAWSPAKELESLRGGAEHQGPAVLKPGDAPVAFAGGELLDARVEFEPVDPAAGCEIEFSVRGVTIRYDAARQEISVNGLKAPAPMRGGRQRLIVLADRTCFEVFAGDGLAYLPLPFIPKADEKGVRFSSKAGGVRLNSIEVHTLKSMWEPPAPVPR